MRIPLPILAAALVLAHASLSEGANVIWREASTGVAKMGTKLLIDATTSDYGEMARRDASGERFVRISPGTSLELEPVTIQSAGAWTVWVRCFALEKRLATVSIDGRDVGSTSGAADQTSLGWQCLGTVELTQGKHTLALSAAQGNSNSAYLDCVALIDSRDAIPVGRKGELALGKIVDRIDDRFAGTDLAAVSRKWQIVPPKGSDAVVDLAPKEDGGSLHIHNGAGQPYQLTSQQFLWLQPGEQITVRVRARKGTLCERLTIGVLGLGTFEPQLYRQFQDAESTWIVPPGTSGPLIITLVGQAGGDTYISHIEAGRPNPPISSYETGRFLPKPSLAREGRLFEIERYVVNPEAITEEDRDHDGKWALCRLSREQNSPWFSRGTVLKSDSVASDRASPAEGCPPLHVRVGPLEPGRYQVYLSIPGRSLAFSRDGQKWEKLPGKQLPSLGVINVPGPDFEFWLDDRYVEPGNPGPTYADFIRFLPVEDPAYTMAACAKPAPLPQGSQQHRSIPITVENEGTAQRNEAVRLGVPVPLGELASPDNTQLRDDTGTNVPAHVTSTGQWPDGSVKWLLVEFLADVLPQAERTFSLEYGNAIQARPKTTGMRIATPGGRVMVDTGSAEWSIDSHQGGHVECHRPGAAGPVFAITDFVLTGTQGQEWRSSRDAHTAIEVEESTPFRTVIRMHGSLAGSPDESPCFAFDTRVHLFAGCDELLVEPGFSMLAQPATQDLASVHLEFSGPWKDGHVLTFLNPEEKARVPLGASPALIQGGDEAYGCEGSYPARLVDGKGTVLAQGQKATGWIRIDDVAGASTLVCVPDFWQQFPKALRSGPKSLRVDLWSAEAGCGPFTAHAGSAKSHPVGVSFGRAPSTERWLAPLTAHCSPEWYCQSGAMEELVPRREGKYGHYESIVATGFDRMLAQRAGYGMENWGDVWQEGYVAQAKTWSNQEWDLVQSWVTAFVRTGERRYLEFAHAASRHFADVDCIHAAADPGQLGGSWMHAHTSLRGHQLEPPNFAHAGWVEGMLNLYHLTGDRRGLEAARGIADYICRHAPQTDHHGPNGPAYHLPIQRPAGWPLTTLGLMYCETWDPVYLQTSRRIVDYTRRIQDPERGIWDAQVGHEVPYRGGCVFAYTLFRGLRLFYETTGETRARDDYLRAAKWIFGEMWRPGHLYLYEQCPLHEPGTKVPFTLSEMAGYATRISGDPIYAAIGYDALQQHSADGAKSWMVDAVRRSQWANGVVQQVPRMLSDWEQTGLAMDEHVTLQAEARSIPVPPGEQAVVRLTLANKTDAALDDVSAGCLIRGDWQAKVIVCPKTILAGDAIPLELTCQSPPPVALYALQNDFAHVHVLVRYRQSGQAKCAWGYARMDATGSR